LKCSDYLEHLPRSINPYFSIILDYNTRHTLIIIKIRLNMIQAEPGMNKWDVETPALLVDVDALERNILRMSEYFAGVDAVLRPHVKTHKSPIIAHKQIKAGAVGITCAKLGEAEVMVQAGIREVLIANQIVGESKIRRLINLARQSHLIVAVDHPVHVSMLSQAASVAGIQLDVLVEVDVGMGRCGVQPGSPSEDLTQFILKSSGLRFRGLMGYEGHAVIEPDPILRKQKAINAMDILLETKALLLQASIPVDIVSCGGSATYDIVSTIPGISEVQAGSYATMDSTYHNIRPEFECAITLLTTVISRPDTQKAILDCGRKSLSQDMGMSQVVGVEGARLVRLSEEHGSLQLDDLQKDLSIGDKVEIIPSHGCTTINLHDHFFIIRENCVEDIWEIEGRGKFW
jgi:D-serine deaminase-like pyridoxal phosphate-dependent protein